jgi:hypothetical protein
MISLCGQSATTRLDDGEVWYLVNVASSLEVAGCGKIGAELTFTVDGSSMENTAYGIVIEFGNIRWDEQTRRGFSCRW